MWSNWYIYLKLRYRLVLLAIIKLLKLEVPIYKCEEWLVYLFSGHFSSSLKYDFKEEWLSDTSGVTAL